MGRKPTELVYSGVQTCLRGNGRRSYQEFCREMVAYDQKKVFWFAGPMVLSGLKFLAKKGIFDYQTEFLGHQSGTLNLRASGSLRRVHRVNKFPAISHGSWEKD